MNPNFLNNINPEQMRQFQNMMTPEMMKGMTSQLNAMSDDQLLTYLSSMGIGHVSPQMFRSMSQNMSNMNNSDFNRMKNANPYMNTSSMPSTNRPITIVDRLDNIKQEGNGLFKQNKLQEACDKYYEVITEIQMNADNIKKDDKLNELERACRLNIANCKLKLKEYDVVINECLKVLDDNKCFKAYYRLGIALLYKGKITQAHEYLDTARIIGSAVDKKAVEPYLKECEKKMKEMKRQKDFDIEECKRREKEEKQQQKEEEEKKEKKKKNEIEAQKEKDRIHEEELRQKHINKDLPIKDKPDIDIQINNEINKTTTQKVDNNVDKHKTSPNTIHSGGNILNSKDSMSDEEINVLIQNMKQTDNKKLKETIKAQGMNCSDEDIVLLKSTITPETFKLMQQDTTQTKSNPDTKSTETSSTHSPPPFIPNFNEMDYQSMLNYLKSNPEMMKMISPQLAQMMQGKDSNPDQVINTMENLLWLLNIPTTIKRFFLSKKGIIIISSIIVLLIAFLYYKK